MSRKIKNHNQEAEINRHIEINRNEVIEFLPTSSPEILQIMKIINYLANNCYDIPLISIIHKELLQIKTYESRIDHLKNIVNDEQNAPLLNEINRNRDAYSV